MSTSDMASMPINRRSETVASTISPKTPPCRSTKPSCHDVSFGITFVKRPYFSTKFLKTPWYSVPLS